jgi:dihydrofolate reductase
MGKVTVDISMSLDGFIAGPNDGPELGLGERGEQLHEWVFGLTSWRERHGLPGGTTDRDAEILDEAFRDTGAIVLGRRMFDNAKGWGDDPPFHMPVFVLTHDAREKLTKEGGTIDEMQIHLVPLMLGGGIRLFDQVDPERVELEGTRVVESPGVTHLKYRVVK